MEEQPEADWHLQEWAKFRGKKQADLVNDLGWQKNAAFRLWHGHQPYRRDFVNAVARWLEIEPYELLMKPDDALGLRRLRQAAMDIAKGLEPVD